MGSIYVITYQILMNSPTQRKPQKHISSKREAVTHGTCNHPNVIKRILEIAKKNKIPIQHESSSRYSGTDTDNISYTGKGIPSALISLPLRYMHSVVEVVEIKDVEKVISVLVKFVKSLKPGDEFGIKI